MVLFLVWNGKLHNFLCLFFYSNCSCPTSLSEEGMHRRSNMQSFSFCHGSIVLPSRISVTLSDVSMTVSPEYRCLSHLRCQMYLYVTAKISGFSIAQHQQYGDYTLRASIVSPVVVFDLFGFPVMVFDLFISLL